MRVEVKNTLVGSDTNVAPDRRPGVVPGAFQPLTIEQLYRSVPTTSNAVEFTRENVFTNAAAETAEGGAKPESSLTTTLVTEPVGTIAHWIKMSVQLLADAPATAAYIEVRLRDGLAQRIDNQLINGNGTSPNLSGFTDSGNFTAYTATSDDNLIDAINRIKWAMWATGNAPDTVYVNPADWGALERLREGTNSGTYLYGAPGTAANANPFGLTVVPTPYLQAGKIIVARLSDSALIYQRAGAVIEMGYVNDDFTKNLVTVRAEERLGLACDRPAGIYFGDFSA
jgi:HK97 family phage major capsid protein